MNIRKIVPVAALAAALLGLGAGPAWAHDTLKSSNPEKGAEIESPREIELVFTGNVRVPQIVLTAADGSRPATGPARAVDDTVTQQVNGPLPNGTYTVGWRVVSSDGHPITGRYEFTVKGSAAPASSPAPAPVASATSPQPAVSEAAEEGGSSSGWLWIGVAALVIVLGTGGVAWARRSTDD